MRARLKESWQSTLGGLGKTLSNVIHPSTHTSFHIFTFSRFDHFALSIVGLVVFDSQSCIVLHYNVLGVSYSCLFVPVEDHNWKLM